MSRTHRALAMLALSLTLATATTAVAAAAVPSPTTGIEDQNDRLLRNLQAGQAERTQASVALARSMERNLAPVPAVDVAAAQPIVRPDVAAPGAGVDVLATLLFGLVGGLVGGSAAIGGWMIATRRRMHRAAATV
jgi:hypothetical protein